MLSPRAYILNYEHLKYEPGQKDSQQLRCLYQTLILTFLLTKVQSYFFLIFGHPLCLVIIFTTFYMLYLLDITSAL